MLDLPYRTAPRHPIPAGGRRVSRWIPLFLVVLFALPTASSAATGVSSEEIRTATASDPGKAAAKQTFVLGRPDDEDEGEGDGDGPDDGSGGDADLRDDEPRGPVIGIDWDLWTTWDYTEQDIFGHTSETNAGNLGEQQPGKTAAMPNTAFCFCVEAGTPGYASAPGYGNNWDQRLFWNRVVPNSGVPTNVKLSFDYNLDTEPNRDFLLVEWSQGGTWVELLRTSGTNQEPNGVFLNAASFLGEFDIQPGEYTGPGNDEIRLRLRVTSDPYLSDEDGLFPSDGAAQVDNLEVRFNNVLISSSDFDPVNDGWIPTAGNVAGDFAKILPLVADLDPCFDNDTFTFAFLDDGTPTNNTMQSTGGETSVNWGYAAGGYVVNHTEGVSNGRTPVHNAVQSWVVPWDIPGPDDDASVGAQLWFRVWKHLPLENGIFYEWTVRSYGSGQWSAWRNHGMAYYSDTAAHWERRNIDVSTLMVASPESVQIRLGVVDLADALALPGGDATPSPMFDDVGFSRYDPKGPVITALPGNLFQDSFPNQGNTNWLADPDSRAVRLDMARDIGSGASILPGDSIVVDARAFAPATHLSDVKLVWALREGPFFGGTRVPPVGAVPLVGTRGPCPGGVAATGFQGEISGVPVTTPYGDPIPHRYSFDLPDGPAHPNAGHQGNEAPFFLAGDVLQYYIEVTDNLGRKTRLPEDTTGFGDFTHCSGYDAEFTIHALPSLQAGLSTPEILVVQDGGGLAAQQVIESAFQQNGLIEGRDYDHFRIAAPGAGLANSLGASGSKGASVAQLDTYSCILWFAEDTGSFLFNDGSGVGLNDKSDDLSLLQQWRGADADRFLAVFGSDFVSGLQRQGPTAAGVVTNRLAATLVADDIRPLIGNQVSPVVSPTGEGPTAAIFSTDFVVGGCFGVEQFDALEPTGDPDVWRSHGFLTPAGVQGYTYAAALWHDRMVQPAAVPRRRVDATFPFPFAAIQDPQSKVGISARALLLGELLDEFGHELPPGPVTPADPTPRWTFDLAAPHPNPFNPATSLRFQLPADGPASLRLFDLRGRVVRTLVSGRLAAGDHRLEWDGRDSAGERVASGIYLAVLEAGPHRASRKLVLVK